MDLGYVLLDCAKTIRDRCNTAGLNLSVAPILNPLPVNGEKVKLRQIFLNLLSNAIAFTEPGGAIAVSAASDDPAWIAVQIADTGIGIPEYGIAAALTDWEQIGRGLDGRYEGTGLTLPLTKALVELHGGEIMIASVQGEGTTVTVRFPNAGIVAHDEGDLIAVA